MHNNNITNMVVVVIFLAGTPAVELTDQALARNAL